MCYFNALQNLYCYPHSFNKKNNYEAQAFLKKDFHAQCFFFKVIFKYFKMYKCI